MEKEKRYSYIRKKLARGTVGACILSGLALLLFLFCLAYSFLKKGEAGPAVAALAFLSVNLSAFSLRLALPFCFATLYLAFFSLFGNEKMNLTEKLLIL